MQSRWPHAGAFIVAAAIVSSGARVDAHAPPMGTGLWWRTPAAGDEATRPAARGDERLVIRTTRGLLVEGAEGGVFRLLCNEAVGILPGEDAPLAFTAGGEAFASTYEHGLLQASANLCQWTSAVSAMTTPSFDVATSGNGASAPLFALTGADESPHLWVRAEEGAPWSPLPGADTPYTRIRTAPGDANRLYLTGISLDDSALGASGLTIHRFATSRDGGRSLLVHRLALGDQELQARVLAVDPGDADHVFVGVEATSDELPERLIVSRDAGETFTTSLAAHDLHGLAQSPDGARVWVGGREGIFASHDGGASFSLTSSGLVAITCLAFHAGRLYACGVLGNALVVAVSDDEGASFSPLLSFADVTESLSCGDARCQEAIAHWRDEVGASSKPGGPSHSAPSTTKTATGTSPAAHGCSVGPGRGADDATLVASVASVLCVLCVLVARGRMRRGSSSAR